MRWYRLFEMFLGYCLFSKIYFYYIFYNPSASVRFSSDTKSCLMNSMQFSQYYRIVPLTEYGKYRKYHITGNTENTIGMNQLTGIENSNATPSSINVKHKCARIEIAKIKLSVDECLPLKWLSCTSADQGFRFGVISKYSFRTKKCHVAKIYESVRWEFKNSLDIK